MQGHDWREQRNRMNNCAHVPSVSLVAAADTVVGNEFLLLSQHSKIIWDDVMPSTHCFQRVTATASEK